MKNDWNENLNLSIFHKENSSVNSLSYLLVLFFRIQLPKSFGANETRHVDSTVANIFSIDRPDNSGLIIFVFIVFLAFGLGIHLLMKKKVENDGMMDSEAGRPKTDIREPMGEDDKRQKSADES